jgi:hypothetical protein
MGTVCIWYFNVMCDVMCYVLCLCFGGVVCLAWRLFLFFLFCIAWMVGLYNYNISFHLCCFYSLSYVIYFSTVENESVSTSHPGLKHLE